MLSDSWHEAVSVAIHRFLSRVSTPAQVWHVAHVKLMLLPAANEHWVYIIDNRLNESPENNLYSYVWQPKFQFRFTNSDVAYLT